MKPEREGRSLQVLQRSCDSLAVGVRAVERRGECQSLSLVVTYYTQFSSESPMRVVGKKCNQTFCLSPLE